MWMRPDGTPFYVGVGSGRRARWPLRNPLADSIRAKIEREGGQVRVAIVHYRTRELCLEAEMSLIAKFGRRDNGTGILANLSDGGERAANPGPETRAKISAARRGTKASEATRQKQSAVRTGRKQSPETIAKRAASLRGRKQDPEAVARRVHSRWKNAAIAHRPLDENAVDPIPVPLAGSTLEV